jgi:hypothetical protein
MWRSSGRAGPSSDAATSAPKSSSESEGIAEDGGGGDNVGGGRGRRQGAFEGILRRCWAGRRATNWRSSRLFRADYTSGGRSSAVKLKSLQASWEPSNHASSFVARSPRGADLAHGKIRGQERKRLRQGWCAAYPSA